MTHPTLRGLAVAATLALTASPAAADVVPPEEMACELSRAGASCSVDGASGQCVESTCSRLDYARWDGGGDGPPTTTYDCLICETEEGGEPDDEGGCSVGAGTPGTSGTSTPWVALGALAAGAWLLRRRR